MPGVSFRESWEKRYSKEFPELDLNKGLRAQVHNFYKDLPERWKAFPYKNLRNLLQALDCVNVIRPTQSSPHDHPGNKETGWSDNLNGVTHDEDHWYFAQEKLKLWKIPITHNLAIDGPDLIAGSAIDLLNGITDVVLGNPSQDGYDHFGDIDYYEGFLYVAVEGMKAHRPAAFFLFDQELKSCGRAELAQGSAPWCAVNPLNGLLYSSDFNGDAGPIKLQVYERIVFANTTSGEYGLKLEHLGEMILFDMDGNNLIVRGIQGAHFSNNGHLYLAIDAQDEDPKVGGIMAFDMITGRRILHHVVDYIPWRYYPLAGWVHTQEIEGITIWENTDSKGAPGIGGQIHLIMLNKGLENVDSDELFFKHYEVPDPKDVVKL